MYVTYSVCWCEQVKCLVFTSTYNVVFGGEEIFGGDERMEMFPLHKHVDHYSRVLASNGAVSRSGPGETEDGAPRSFRTCALRPNGIVGLGEQRHCRRVLSALRSGLLRFTYGRNSVVDFVGIQNVVQAHIKALFQLDAEGSSPTSGNAFFISDEAPVNNFEFFRPLIEGLGYSYPTIDIPFPFIMMFARLQDLVYKHIHNYFPFTPFVTPAEAFKTSRTHYFHCQKARKSFQYNPTRPNDVSQILNFFLDSKINKMNSTNIDVLQVAFCVFLGLAIFCICIYVLYKLNGFL
ncbi:UNVERIFIED_CONTAM: hypothetical protein GTU68_045094 [Idotea baltica]|nr:hypothetical protein [Idotea baltica]